MASISYSVCAIQNMFVLLNSSWISAYNYDNISDTILITDKKLLHFKFSKSGQIYMQIRRIFPGLVTITDSKSPSLHKTQLACKFILHSLHQPILKINKIEIPMVLNFLVVSIRKVLLSWQGTIQACFMVAKFNIVMLEYIESSILVAQENDDIWLQLAN